MSGYDPHEQNEKRPGKNNPFDRFLKGIGRAFRDFPLTALLSVIGGILLIVFPVGVLALLIRLIGIAVMLYGILRILALVFGREEGAWDLFSFLLLICDISMTAVGLILTVSPADTLGFLTLITGVYLIAEGIVTLYRLLMARSILSSVYGITTENRAERAILMILCFLGIGAGLFLLIQPGNAIRTVAVIIGVSLLISGLQNGCTYFIVKKKKRKQEIEEGNFYTDDFVDKSN